MTTTPPGGERGTMKLLASRIGGVAGSLAAGQLLLGLTYVLAARSMEPAGLGQVATCVAIGTIGAVVFDGGLSSYLVRETASGRLSMSRARALRAAKRRLVSVLVIPNALACILIMPTVRDGIVLAVVGWFVWEAQSANALLRAEERFARAATGQVSGRAVGLVATVVLLVVTSPELALSVGIAIAFVAESVLDSVSLRQHGRATATRLRTLGTEQRRSVSYGLINLSANGQQLDTPMVTLGGGLAAGGIYAGAGRLLGPLLFLSSAMAFVASPWLARAQSDPVALRTEERRILRLGVVLAVAPIVAAAVGPIAIPWLLGDQYALSGPAFSVLAVGGALSTASQGAAVILQNRGAERSVGIAIAIGLAFGLGANYLLAAVGGPVWAAAGYVLSQVYIAAHLAVALRSVRRAAGADPSR